MKSQFGKFCLSAVTAALCTVSITPTAATADTKQACSVRNADAAIVRSVPLDWPDFDLGDVSPRRAMVRIDLRADGSVDRAVVVRSTGIPLLDQTARLTAMRQVYAPEIHDCAAVAGSYLVGFTFDR